MSSTNRSAAREAHVSDYYVTPQHTIKEFLDALTDDCAKGVIDFDLTGKPLIILDPCAGGSADYHMAYPQALGLTGWNIGGIVTIDIRADSRAEVKADYLAREMVGGYDVTITNPPFNAALPIIQKALRESRTGGLVIMLLRLNFFGSKARQSFFQANMPAVTYIHTRRPKFLNGGGTDSIEYMHAVWVAGRAHRFTQMRII